MLEYDFTKRCPSRTQIKAALVKGLKTSDWVAVNWGENRIVVERLTIYYCSRSLTGSGWIRRHGGYDLANELMNEGMK